MMTKVLGLPIEILVGSLTNLDLLNIDMAKIGATLRALMMKLGEDELGELIRAMGKSTEVKRKHWQRLSEIEDTWWPRHMKELFPCLLLFLEVQFKDFFVGARDAMAATEGGALLERLKGSQSQSDSEESGSTSL
jgi:hypothetical protein